MTTVLAARPAAAAAPRKRSSQGRARVTASGDDLALKDDTGQRPLATTAKRTHETRERTARRGNALGFAIFVVSSRLSPTGVP